MRLAALALVASLALSSGCAVLAIAGSAGGAAIGTARRKSDPEVSVANHAVVGALAGFLIDAVAIVILVNHEDVIQNRTR